MRKPVKSSLALMGTPANPDLRLLVAPEDEGARIDRYVAGNVPDMSRSYAHQLLTDGHITLNGAEARQRSCAPATLCWCAAHFARPPIW